MKKLEEVVAKTLDIGVREEFKIKGISGVFFINLKGLAEIVSDSLVEYRPELLYKLLKGDLEIDRWPEKGDEYFFPAFYCDDRVDKRGYYESYIDDNIKNTVGRYRTKEEAQYKARELGWIG